jgi:hypothetical protein
MELEMLGWWILGLAVFAISVISYALMRNSNFSLLSFVKNILRFGA